MHTETRTLFGRDRELAEADVALAAAATGTPRALLVGGDAGIGKTSLADAIADRARQIGFTVIEGHCLDIESAESLAPVREALRGHVIGRPLETLPPVTRRLAPFLCTNDPGDATSDPAVDFRLALAELAVPAPLLLVLEDMHWADQSTQDFATAVARTAHGACALLLTFRSDELTRRHPFRRALIDIGRGVGSTRLDLEPMGRTGIAGIVDRVTGHIDPALVGSVLARSEGNPLYAEELLGASSAGVPAALGELLLARVDALSGSTRDLIRLASANGSRLDTVLLAAAAEVDEASVEAGLREALDANVLTSTAHEVDFRHGLLREAVYDDLLPGERTRAHARWGIVLDEQLSSGSAPETLGSLGRLAFHWEAAREQARALAASVRAGVALRRVGQREAMVHLERALDLWDQVPDPETVAGVARADVLRLMAQGAKSADGNDERAMRLIREAIRLVDDGTEHLLASRVYAAYAEMCHELDDELGHHEAVTTALRYAEGEPSEELARALLVMAQWHGRQNQLADSLDFSARAAQAARSAVAPAVEAEALAMRGQVLFDMGRCRQSVAQLTVALDVAERAGLLPQLLEIQGAKAFQLLMTGEIESGTALATSGRARALANGLGEQSAFCGWQVAEAMVYQGRLDEADLLGEDLRTEGMPQHWWRMQRTWALIARGDFAAAEPLVRESLSLYAESVGLPDGYDLLQAVDIHCGLGDPGQALRLVDEHLTAVPWQASRCLVPLTARASWTAVACAVRSGVEVAPTLMRSCRDVLAAALAAVDEEHELRGSLPATGALVADAFARTLDGASAVEAWRSAEAACAPYGAYHALLPRLELAAALLSAGERDEGRSLVTEVWQSARAMGARHLEKQAVTLARHNRIQLAQESLPRQLSALTAREREVLDVLATGATNRTIAGTLFISEKTVSVHVTNLLAKLGVSNRGEAAALARELASS